MILGNGLEAALVVGWKAKPEENKVVLYVRKSVCGSVPDAG